MANKKSKRKYTNPFNLYETGGWQQLKDNFGGMSAADKGGLVAGGLGLVTNALKQALIADTSGIESNIAQQTNAQINANSNTSLMDEWSATGNLGQVQARDLRGGSVGGGLLQGALSGAGAGATLGPLGAGIGAAAGLLTSGIGSIIGGAKARNKADELNAEIEAANERRLRGFENKAMGIDKMNDLSAMAGFFAMGGKFTPGTNILQPRDSEGNRRFLLQEWAQNRKNPPIEFGGGKFGGAGAGSVIGNNYQIPIEWTDTRIPIEGDSFNDSFKRAREAGKKEFTFNGKKFNTDLAPDSLYNPNAGKAREQLRLRMLYDEDNNIIQDSTRFEPELGQPVVNTIDKGMRDTGSFKYGGKINSSEIAKGTKEEMEHTSSKKVSRKTAMEHLREDPEYYTKLKKAGLADSYAGGGELNQPTFINEGGTHEQNPFQGVPMGMDDLGRPNLVEEGEVKFNDYIFSNRLNANSKDLQNVGLGNKYANHSYAKIAEKLSKESKERPHDPISKRGLLDSMSKLTQAQEQHKMKTNKNNSPNKFAFGDWLEKNSSTIEKGLRYAPVLGSALGVFSDLTGKTNTPNYSEADMVMSANKPVSALPIGDYLTYNPLDRNYYTNKLNQLAAATRGAITNSAAGNRSTAIAGLLAADRSTQDSMGDLFRRAEEFNLGQRERVASFNRGTNQYNADNAFRADAMNSQMGLESARYAAMLRNRERTLTDANKAANLTNLFDNIGNVGREAYARDMVNSNPANFYEIKNGRIVYKNMDGKTPEEKAAIQRAAEEELLRDLEKQDKKTNEQDPLDAFNGGLFSAFGGRLNNRKRR